MEYLGEHLLPGQLGHLFLVLSLITSIAATFSYFKSTQSQITETKRSWKALARTFYIVQAFSVFAVFGILYYILDNHYFEYKYAWQHTNLALEPKYILSSIWEGQEGSFLLWSVWHALVGLVFIWREKEWEAPVMTTVSFAQFCIATMVIGINVFGTKIGSNPFILMRNSGLLNDPGFYDPMTGLLKPGYLQFITDGNGLNVLLQNYWMVIHPPVLFLGFASTIFPFAFVLGGLWTRKYTEWTRAALPWTLFSGAVLGLGIMMGAAWAYESLNFGGYWAWDPVENASLVPWLVLIAGLHTLVIYRHTGNALRSTYFFLLLAFGLVLYSTYLTRSGVLQDTSVHAFTLDDDGEDWFLILQFMLLPIVFFIPSVILFFKRYKEIPSIAKEEEASSREFWMFIGSLILFLSGLLIICMTSVPVFNKLIQLFTGKENTFPVFAFGEDTEFAHNRIQIWVAIVIGSLTAFGMYLKYKASGKETLKKLILPVALGVALGGLIVAFGNISYDRQGIFYLAAIWMAVIVTTTAVVTNAAYIFTGFKGVAKKAGGAIAHFGFGLFLLGVLISSSKKEVLSWNTSGITIPFGKESKEKPGENLTLILDTKMKMGDFWVTYSKDSLHPKKDQSFYFIDFERQDGKENFTLVPNAFMSKDGLAANPDAKHYWNYDIFTYISSVYDPNKVKDTAQFKTTTIKVGDTAWYAKGFYVLDSISSSKNVPGTGMGANDSLSYASLRVYAQTGSIYNSKPWVVNKGGNIFNQPDTLIAEGLIFSLQAVRGNEAILAVKQTEGIMKFVTLKAYKFPFINLVWAGTIIMIIGFLISMIWRMQKRKTAGTKAVQKAKTEPEKISIS
jgi:cytochrome c-type biogenesis protein CcmF